MFALIQFKNIKGKASLSEKIKEYEVLGVYESVKEIEDRHKNYFSHKYRLMDNSWCYFVRKPQQWNQDIDSHELADRMIIEVQFDKLHIFDYLTSTKVEQTQLIRDIKLSMLCKD
jgi:hypothetical protein